LRAAGIDVVIGVERDPACELNAPFFNAHINRRAWVTLKLAISADGGIADPSGRFRWITGPESRLEVHRLRANTHAIAVGIGTVLADDPELTVRDVPPPRVDPCRVVFDRMLRIPLDSKLVRTAHHVPTIVVSGADTRLDAGRSADGADTALLAAGVEILRADTTADALDALWRHGIRSLFVEGGAALAGALISEALVDRLIIFRSPLVLGAGALSAFGNAPPDFVASLRDSRIVDERSFGDDTMTIYALKDVPCSPD
jgi:diaminohydroxyphosphoribosylaminopyrimidine deaminase / 5-amino-6-(5-phosphoribosylamino)uracil reductase